MRNITCRCMWDVATVCHHHGAIPCLTLLNLNSRAMVGWAMGPRLSRNRPEQGLRMAASRRTPGSLRSWESIGCRALPAEVDRVREDGQHESQRLLLGQRLRRQLLRDTHGNLLPHRHSATRTTAGRSSLNTSKCSRIDVSTLYTQPSFPSQARSDAGYHVTWYPPNWGKINLPY